MNGVVEKGEGDVITDEDEKDGQAKRERMPSGQYTWMPITNECWSLAMALVETTGASAINSRLAVAMRRSEQNHCRHSRPSAVARCACAHQPRRACVANSLGRFTMAFLASRSSGESSVAGYAKVCSFFRC